MNETIIKLINCLLAGLLVTLGSLSNGEPNMRVLYYAAIAGAIVAITQFKEQLSRVKGKRGKVRLFSFI